MCWFDSPEEAGRYLETYKSYEKKPADLLKEQVEKNYLSKVGEFIIFSFTAIIDKLENWVNDVFYDYATMMW